MRAPRVVGLGLCVVDHLYRVEGQDLSSGRLRYRVRRMSTGGMTATALAQAAALGCDAHLLSAVGDDAEGRYLRRALRGLGVRTRGLLLSPRTPTTVAVVLVDARSGERRFVVADRRRLEARAPRLDLDVIAPGSVLLLDGHFPVQALRAARRARAVGATVVGDFHRETPGVRRLLPWVDHAIVPLEFAELRGTDPRRTLRDLASLCRGAPCVTLGRRGGIYLEAGRVRRFRAVPARVVDTTGAGDVLHGACTALGGSARLLPRRELLRLLRRRGAGGRAGR